MEAVYPKSDREIWQLKHFLDCQPFNIRQLQLAPHGGVAWQHLRLGERYIRKAVAWYRHKYHSPHEWRPALIIEALCYAAGLSPKIQPVAWRSG